MGADGSETFTPRTVIYDLKGGFGSLRRLNALYEISEDIDTVRGLWDGSTSSQYQRPIEPSRYQTLLEQGLPTFQLHDNDVRYWSDFNRVYYHPRSAVQLNQYELNSQIMPFEKWTAGEDLFQDLDKEFDILDRDVRPFAEECDHMQGFQMISGVDDAWGGFASRYVDSLRDEYGKTSIWVWGIEDGSPAPRHVRMNRLGNTARSLRGLGQQASVYIPLNTTPSSLPHYVNLQSQSDWITSALLCSAVESVTLPTRLRGGTRRQASLSLLEDALNTNGGQKLLELQLSGANGDEVVSNGLSNGIATGGGFDEHESEGPSLPNLDVSFLPRTERAHGKVHVFAQAEVQRSPQQRTALEVDIEERMRMRANDETVVDEYKTDLLFPGLDTFPDTLFRTQVQGSGLALTAALRTSSKLKKQVIELRGLSLRGLDLEERESMYNDLTELASGYSFGWEDGSDSGEDD